MSTVTGTLTSRYSLLKPDLDPQDVWGCEINLNLDKIDQAVLPAELVTVSGFLQTNLNTHTGDSTIHFTKGSIDHGGISGLGDDDHIIYTKADGTRAFTGKVVGVDPTAAQHLTTKTYVDSADVTISGHLQSELDNLAPLTVKEVDGTPTVTNVDTIRFSNGSVTDDGSGQVSISIAAEGVGVLIGEDGVTVISGTPLPGEVTLSGFRGEFVLASGSLQDQLDGLDPGPGVILGSDGNTVVSGSNQVTVVGFRPEFVAASGFLQADIDAHEADSSIHYTVGSLSHTSIQDIGSNSHIVIDNHIADGTIHFTEGSIDHTAITNIGSNSHADIDTHLSALATSGTLVAAEVVTVSGFLQTQIDAVEGSDVDSVNAVTGAVLVTGTQNVTTQTAGQTITITGPDLTSYATTAEVVTVSGHLQGQIDGNTTSINTNITDISNNATNIVTTSGHLQTEIDALGAGTITDINGQGGPSVTITGAGTVNTATVGNTITISGASSDTGSYTHEQTTGSTEWIINHDLNTEVFNWSFWKFPGDGGESIQPDYIVPSGVSYARAFFNPATSGIGFIAKGEGSQGVQGPPGPQREVEVLSGFIEAMSDKTFVIERKAYYSYDITEMNWSSTIGTGTFSLEIDGTVIEGIDNLSIDNSNNTEVPTSAYTVASGSQLTLVASGNSSDVVDFNFSIMTERLT